ncbi:hypothetical protein ABZ312_33635 [Streptomyces sp. NPDC006207]|nr:hypothetical protein [Streptomyces sp. PA03-5A]
MAGDQNERDATGVHLMASAYKRWQNMPPVMLNLSRADAWIVMVGLQTAVAHPLVSGGPMSAAMEEMGRRIQEAICDDPEVYAVAESGWNRIYDVFPTDVCAGRTHRPPNPIRGVRRRACDIAQPDTAHEVTRHLRGRSVFPISSA